MIKYRQNSEKVQSCDTVKIVAVHAEDAPKNGFSSNLVLEKKLNAEFEPLKEEVLRSTGKESILTKPLEVLLCSKTAERNDLKQRIGNAEKGFFEFQQHVAVDVRAKTSNAETSSEPCAEDDEISTLGLELETARLIFLGKTKKKLDQQQEKDKKDKEEMQRIAEAERLAKEIAKIAPHPIYDKGSNWSALDGGFGCG